jgi:hypothetical protein
MTAKKFSSFRRVNRYGINKIIIGEKVKSKETKRLTGSNNGSIKAIVYQPTRNGLGKKDPL